MYREYEINILELSKHLCGYVSSAEGQYTANLKT